MTDLTVSYRMVGVDLPDIDLFAEVESPRENVGAALVESDGEWTAEFEDSGVRGGYVTVILNEPDDMLCNVINSTTPTSGSSSLKGYCMTDGLIPVLL